MIDRVFLDFFQTLESRDIRAAVLHSHEGLPEKISSDVDFVVAPQAWGQLVSIQAEVASKHGWVIAQVLRHETTACYSVLINPDAPDQFLKLDACTDYVCGGRRFLTAESLLAGRRAVRGFFVAAPGAECIYRLVKAVHKSKKPGEVLPIARALYADSPTDAEEAFARTIDAGRPLSDWLEGGTEDWPGFAAKIAAAGVPFQRPAEWLRKLRRFCSPTGLRVSLLGPDGAGKSTLLSRMRETLSACFRRDVVFHFRPRTFEQASESAPVTEPHAQQPRSAPAGFFKTLYYFADHVLGHWLRVRPAMVRSSLVIFDRDFEDLIADPVRFRLRGVALARLLSHFVPKSNVTLILDAEASTIRARKPELSEQELTRQRAFFGSLAGTKRSAHLLNAELPPEEVACDAARIIITALAKRTTHREKLPADPAGRVPHTPTPQDQ